jgi:hypothetical protein
MTHLELFKRRQNRLLNSDVWPKTVIYRMSDMCADGQHRACPGKAKFMLVDIGVVCNCRCHYSVKNKKVAGTALRRWQARERSQTSVGAASSSSVLTTTIPETEVLRRDPDVFLNTPPREVVDPT